MPKLLHEALVQLIRAAPEVIVELIRPLLGELSAMPALAVVPQITAAELVNLDLPELRADTVLVFGDPQRPSLALVVEAQGEIVPRKRRVWPFYVTGFGVRFDCPVMLVVLALDDKVAAWSREAIDFGGGRGFLYPLVIGSHDVPVIVDPQQAMAAPELAVLSVLAHGKRPGAEYVARAALAACERLDTQAGIHYADFVAAFLGAFAKLALRQIMQTETKNPYFSAEFRKMFDDGYVVGEAEGEARGKALGKALGKAQSLLKMFRLRGWTTPADVEARILACQDEAQVDLWIERVLAVGSLDEVFAAG